MGSQEILVIGGGISGVTAAVEAAEVGYDVTLIEQTPYLGGRVSKMNSYFPKLCAPDCGLEINYRRIKMNPKVKVITQAEVESISGQAGDYEAAVKVTPRMVNDNCTACGKCVEACPIEIPNEFNYGMDKCKAISITNGMAFPQKYAINKEACDGCGKCKEVCEYNAIDLDMAEETLNIKAGGIVVATGWTPYEANNLDNLAYGKAPNVIANVMLERLAALDGPTQGKILRPSDSAEPKSIAFVQCAGSRDQNHLPYCSGVCCMGSLKQINYVKEQYPDAQISMYYIDIRAMGYLEDFLCNVQEMENVSLVKGKVAKITEVANGNLKLEVEDIAAGNKISPEVDMVVLATGLVPAKIPGDINYDEYGFVSSENFGIVGAGCAKKPTDVSNSVMDATGATIKAIQSAVGGGA